MKKVLLSTLLTTLALGLVAPAALAVDKNTEGVIKFEPESVDDIILPETEPPIVVTPPTGSETEEFEAGLNMTVPGLEFGTVKMKMTDAEYNPLPQVYTNKETPATKYTLPPMAIVRDARGLAAGTGDWSLKVSAGQFKDDTKGVNLGASTLSFVKPRVFNSMRTVPGQEITALGLPNITFTKTSVNVSSGSQLILSSKDGAAVGQTTYMLDEEAKYVIKNPGATGQEVTNLDANTPIKGVTLKVPGSVDKDKTATYKSVLTWTLSNTPD